MISIIIKAGQIIIAICIGFLIFLHSSSCSSSVYNLKSFFDLSLLIAASIAADFMMAIMLIGV